MKIHEDRWLSIFRGDCRQEMANLPPESVDCVVTSPPYFGLRDYGTAEWLDGDPACSHRRKAPGPTQNKGNNNAEDVPFREKCGLCGAIRVDSQIGLESSIFEYVDALLGVFREIRRILVPQGSIWLNLGDSYSSGSRNSSVPDNFRRGQVTDGKRTSKHQDFEAVERATAVRPPRMDGIKPKDLLGVPWEVALALRNDGWYLRADIVWAKPNPMPESVEDRPTRSHEFIFLLTKNPTYYYDGDAVKEPVSQATLERISQPNFANQTGGPKDGLNPSRSMRKALENLAYKHEGAVRLGNESIASPNRVWGDQDALDRMAEGRNLRDVWTVGTQAYPGAHFAVFPPKLIEPCILAGCPKNGVVLDPFAGSGTTGMVANRLGRRAILIDLNAEYIEQIFERNRDMYLGL